jgi:hypothetical protein
MSAPQSAIDAASRAAIREYRHRYPWRAEELFIISALLTIPTLVTFTVNGWASLGAQITIAVCAVLGLYLCHLGKSRKDRSALHATLQGPILRVSETKGGMRGSIGDLSEMAVVRVNGTDRIDPYLTLETKPNESGSTRSVHIQMRLARVMGDDLRPYLERCSVSGKSTQRYVTEVLDPTRQVEQ